MLQKLHVRFLLQAAMSLMCLQPAVAIPSLDLVSAPTWSRSRPIFSMVSQRRVSSLRGGNSTSPHSTPQNESPNNPITEKFVAGMLDQTEELLNKAESDSRGADFEIEPRNTEPIDGTSEPMLSPDVEKMLENEIEKILQQEQGEGGETRPEQAANKPVQMQRVGSATKVDATNKPQAEAQAASGPSGASVSQYAELANSLAATPPRSFAEWFLPKIVPGLFLLLVASIILAVLDGSMMRVIKSTMDSGFGKQTILALAQDSRGRDLFMPLLCIVGGWVFSNWLAFAAQRRMLEFLMVDETTALFLQGFVKWGSLAIAISVVIRAMGYKTAGLDALLASSGVAIAFASQTVLKNFAAGLIILLFRPFQVGDHIKIGKVQGTVTSIGILETQVISDGGVRITYSNGVIKENSLENLTMHGMRRVEVPITVVCSSDAVETRRVIEEAVEPFMHLWKKQPARASARNAKQAGRTKSIGELVLGRTAIQVIMAKYQSTIRLLDRDGDGVVSGAELLGALSGDLLSRIAGDVKSGGSRFAQAQRGYVICTGANELGLQWFAHIWAPSHDHDPTFVRATEAIVKALQKADIKIACKC